MVLIERHTSTRSPISKAAAGLIVWVCIVGAMALVPNVPNQDNPLLANEGVAPNPSLRVYSALASAGASVCVPPSDRSRRRRVVA